MKRIALSAFALLCVAGSATAAPIPLPSNTGLVVKFRNIELIDVSLLDTLTAPVGTTYAPFVAEGTMGNWGLIVVTDILFANVPAATPHDELTGDTGVTEFFHNTPGAGGHQIVGLFYGIDLTTPNKATGGHVDLFWHEGTSLDVGSSTPTAASVNAFTAGTFLASIDMTPGISQKVNGDGDCTTTVFSAGGVNVNDGFADSYGNVNTALPGAYTDGLNGNYFDNPCSGPQTSDIRFKNSFHRILNPANAWFGNGVNVVGANSDDPAQLFTVETVPEPASLTLLGVGLAALARRRRKKA